MIFLEGRLPKYFFQEICSSGGKQAIHKVSAAFIVKNCHPRTSLIYIYMKFRSCQHSFVAKNQSNPPFVKLAESINILICGSSCFLHGLMSVHLMCILSLFKIKIRNLNI